MAWGELDMGSSAVLPGELGANVVSDSDPQAVGPQKEQGAQVAQAKVGCWITCFFRNPMRPLTTL